MSKSNIAALQALADNLLTVAMEESDPSHWAGGDKPTQELTKGERGDRLWDKKSAAATWGLVKNIHTLIAQMNGDKPVAAANDDDEEESAHDATLRRAEEEAAEIMRSLKEKYGDDMMGGYITGTGGKH